MLGLNINPTLVAGVVISFVITPFWLLLITMNLELSKHIAKIVYGRNTND